MSNTTNSSNKIEIGGANISKDGNAFSKVYTPESYK